MSAQMLGNGTQAPLQQHPQQRQQSMPDVQQLMQRVSFLRKNPTEQKNPHEAENILKYLAAIGQSS